MRKLFAIRPLMLAMLAAIGLASAVVAASLQTTLNHNIVATYRGSNDLGGPSFSLTGALQPAIRLENGVGTNQADLLFSDQRTLTASGTENLDLAGALVDPFGTTLTFAKVKVIKVCAAAANTNNVVLGNHASAAFVGPFGSATHTIAVQPGGCALLIAPRAGWTVTPTTADMLMVTNSAGGTSVTYDVIIIGSSS